MPLYRRITGGCLCEAISDQLEGQLRSVLQISDCLSLTTLFCQHLSCIKCQITSANVGTAIGAKKAALKLFTSSSLKWFI